MPSTCPPTRSDTDNAFTRAPSNAPPPPIINPLSVNLADNIARLRPRVDTLLPLHGRTGVG